MKSDRILLTGLGLLILVLVACSPTAPAAQNPAEETVDIQPTNTLPPPTIPPTATDTAEPTPTYTQEPTLTPEPTATQTPDRSATKIAEKETTQKSQEADIKAELEKLNLDPERGRLAWMNTLPLIISLDTYNTESIAPLDDGAEYSDFILKADLTWESTGGLVTCGFWLRSESIDFNAAHYLFQTLRLSGIPAWDVEYWKYKEWVTTVSAGGRVQASNYINQKQGATNTYVIVADESVLTIYVNGFRLGTMTVATLSEGILASYIWQESGESTCTWDNMWIWDLSAE